MLSAILSTLAGKIAAAGTAATVTVGGLGAAGALPDPVQDRVANVADHVGLSFPSEEHGADDDAHDDALPDEASDETGDDAPDEANEASDEGRARAEEMQAWAQARREAALAFAQQVRDWTSCVRDAAVAHGESGSLEPFDPTSACGEHPQPGDDLTSPPPFADDAGDEPGEAPDSVPSGPPSSVPPTGGRDDAPEGSDVPESPSADALPTPENLPSPHGRR